MPGEGLAGVMPWRSQFAQVGEQGSAIAAYLDKHELTSLVAHIEGRDSTDASRMKPNPWTITRALNHLRVPPSDAVLVGDAITEVEAVQAVDVPFIGYANKPGKAARLRAAGASAIVTHMQELAAVTSAAGRFAP